MKKILTKIYNKQNLTLQELNEFIEKYVEEMRGKVPTIREIQQISNFIRQGLFDITFAAKEFVQKLGWTTVMVQVIKTGEIKRIDIYD